MPIETQAAEPTQQPGEVNTANNDLFSDGESVQESELSTGEEPGTSVEGEETGDAQAQAGDGETTQEDSEWLPSEQDKEFNDEVYTKYAQRYKLSPEEAADPRNRLWLKDKINADIDNRNLRAQLEALKAGEQEEGEETEEAKLEPTQQVQTPQQRTAAIKQHFQQIESFVDEITDPEIAASFHDDFMRAAGVPEESVKAAKPEAKVAFAKTASKYLYNLMIPAVQSIMLAPMGQGNPSLFERQFGEVFGKQYPGFAEDWTNTSNERSWRSVVSSKPEYKDLPAYGTEPWKQAFARLDKEFPEIAELKGDPGKTFLVKSRLAARLLSGQKVNPQLVQQAVETGKKQQQQATRTKVNGQLGAGQSSRGTKDAGVTNNDDIFGPGEEQWKQLHGKLSSRK